MASMRDVVGVFPVHPAIVVAAKVGFALSWTILGLRLAGVDLLGVTWPDIVLAEERSLRDRFGAEWQNYRAVVRRYL